MKNGLAEVVVEVVEVSKVQPMSDSGNPKGVAGAKRNPRRRYGVDSQMIVLFLM